MSNIKLIQQMKNQTVTDALKAEHSRLQIDRFLKVRRSFVVKVRKGLDGGG